MFQLNLKVIQIKELRRLQADLVLLLMEKSIKFSVWGS